MITEFRLDDLVQLRRPHACGGDRWLVVRLGADIGLRCQQCGRRVLLERRMVEQRLRAFVERGPAPPSLANPRPAAAATAPPEGDAADGAVVAR